uniref:4-aminobutyrate aminotransferase family protein n=1 Tax=Desulfovibrio sp. U5L TaxID=596152 RepID=I2Q7L1_9BACT
MPEATLDFTPRPVPLVHTAYRRIQTMIPPPEALAVMASLERTESRSMHGQLPLVWDRAAGYQVADPYGNVWIDFTSSIFLANVGHANPRVVAALRRELEKPLLHAYNYPTVIRAEYLEYLIANTPARYEKAFLLSAGTEATECGLKLLRLAGRESGKRRPGVVCFEGNWHGRTMGAQMLSNNLAQKAWIGFEDPNIHHLPFPYPWLEGVADDPAEFFRKSFESLLDRKGLDPDRDLCGVLFESYQGWGAWFYPQAFIDAVFDTAHRHGLLVCADEVQSGFGRTGELFAFMHYGREPDILCCGKGASSSLPLSLVLGPAAVMDLPEVGSMSSTHSANPLACAAGLASLQALLEDGLLERGRRLGPAFHARLQTMAAKRPDRLRYVNGAGLLAGLILMDPDLAPLSEDASRTCLEALQRGLLLVHTGRESIKMAPPLCIPEDALTEGLDVLEVCLDAQAAQP